MLKGEVKNVVVGSQGTLQLGGAWETPVEEFQDVWSINSIVVIGGTIYIGTSPNGGIFEYSLGKLTKIYPLESQEQEQPEPEDENSDADDEPNDPNTVEAKEYLANEHIFAMATDVAGRLLAGISGKECKLLSFEAGRVETIFEPNDANYIFAIATDVKGNIYLGTGPQGKVYRLDPFSRESSGVLYDSPDKNILSLAVGQDGLVYAGSDDRGVIYRIDPHTGKASALYDSEQPEITALLLNKQGDLYAAATSAEMAQAEAKFASKLPLAGRPETKSTNGKTSSESDGARQLRIPNTKKDSHDKSADGKPAMPKPPKPDKASYLYKVSKEGYVTDIFSEPVVLFCLAERDNSLLVGTGNNAQLFSVEPAREDSAVIYEDEQASQITAVTLFGKDVYLGTSNPAKLIKLTSRFAAQGTYTSDLIDAGQPARWGKLQVEADIPSRCKIMVASRSGNVKDVNDPTFSEWTQPEEVTGPVQLRCPLGRFCQYELTLKSDNGSQSPVVREVAVASTIPNLAPQVELVSVGRIEAAGKEGTFKIAYKAKDDNGDKLAYKIDFRKVAKTVWIELKDELEADSFEWDGKTVEDGRYEVRVTASDQRDNTPTTKLTASRVSDPVIIDNTGPVIKDDSIERKGTTVTLTLRAVDVFSAIDKLDYTVDSNEKWITAIPADLVYDTADETFTITIEDLNAGDHLIALRVADDAGNTTYKTFEVTIPNT
jgi:hypothetical protein